MTFSIHSAFFHDHNYCSFSVETSHIEQPRFNTFALKIRTQLDDLPVSLDSHVYWDTLDVRQSDIKFYKILYILGHPGYKAKGHKILQDSVYIWTPRMKGK